jgi:hypothetical protein
VKTISAESKGTVLISLVSHNFALVSLQICAVSLRYKTNEKIPFFASKQNDFRFDLSFLASEPKTSGAPSYHYVPPASSAKRRSLRNS